MPTYACPACGQTVERPASLARGETVACARAGCSGAIGHKNRDYRGVEHAYDGMSFVPAKRLKVAAPVVVSASGRSAAAPVRTTWPGTNLHPDVTHAPSLTAPPWVGAGDDKIGLAYHQLDVARDRMEGLLIDCPEAVGKPEAQAHFLRVKMQLTNPRTPTDAAEATGEAAAALCILREKRIGVLSLSGFEMRWGLHVHKGPGIDQIWKRVDGTGRPQYLIVEAKGPNQSLNDNRWMPPDFDQMSIRWIMHNLETMRRQNHAIGAEILADLGVTTSTRWPAFAGQSKNYYGVTAAPSRPGADLFGVVVTAVWGMDGSLGYARSGLTRYADLAH
jgi:hypothetical protein